MVDGTENGVANDENILVIYYYERHRAIVVSHYVEEGTNALVIADVSGSTFNRLDDYQRFYNRAEVIGKGEKALRHDYVHNLFGGKMTQAASEGLKELFPDHRTLLYSRASCIGSHRYGGIWTGDNNARWNHMETEIKMLPGLNMCGYLYSGADIGGFAEQTTEDLMLRWMALGIFTPLMRNHSAWDARHIF